MGEKISGPVVLIVDDEPMIRMFAVDVMQDAGFIVFEAQSGPDAMTVINLHPEITALFTDIQMPGLFDGLELARQVHSQRPDIWLYLASGAIRPDKQDIPDHGQFFAKPYDVFAIAKMIGDQHAHA